MIKWWHILSLIQYQVIIFLLSCFFALLWEAWGTNGQNCQLWSMVIFHFPFCQTIWIVFHFQRNKKAWHLTFTIKMDCLPFSLKLRSSSILAKILRSSSFSINFWLSFICPNIWGLLLILVLIKGGAKKNWPSEILFLWFLH